MKLLVVGASGMVGQHIYEHALEYGCDVIGTSHQNKENQRFIPFDLLTQDICEVVDATFLNSVDEKIAFICAAMSKIDQCKIEAEKSYQLNVVCTQKLIQKLDDYGFKIVYTSSSAVYDGLHGGYDESFACLPITEYGRQKRAVENFMMDTIKNPLIFRMDKIVSDDNNKNNLFVELLAKINDNAEIPCLEQIFAPTYVKDLGPIFLGALKKNLMGIYNVCNPNYFSRYDFTKLFLMTMGNLMALDRLVIRPMSYFSFVEPRMSRSDMSINKLKNHLVVKFTDIENVIQHFLFCQKKSILVGV